MKRIVFAALGCLILFSCTREVELSIAEPLDRTLWRGERAGLSVDVRYGSSVGDTVCFSVTGLPDAFATVSVVERVLGDSLGGDCSQCGVTAGDGRDSISVFDRITSRTAALPDASGIDRLWLSISIPKDAKSGLYRGKVLATSSKGVKASETFVIRVGDRILPAPEDWKFHLDLWQNPYSAARYFDVPLWSEEHFACMAPTMKRLADAGQKVVTATILDRPWNGQTEDPFGSMVVKTLGRNGRWTYDYTAFDKWVEFMFSLGIDSQINCYSMIPWRLSYDYVDARTGELRFLEAAPGSKQYNDYWGAFIRDFAAHLRAKGWFEKTYIAMDERPEESMKAALAVIKNAEPEMKVSLAGVSHPSINDMIDDLCTTFAQPLDPSVVEERRKAGMNSTFYTCCTESLPNTFLASDPMEATWLAWFAAANGLDGYLRWAYNSWTADPLADARFRTWPAGDCFIVYPDGSSVRFERLVEGIQDFEKMRILRQEWASQGASDKLEALDNALESFTLDDLMSNGAGPAIAAARKVLE